MKRAQWFLFVLVISALFLPLVAAQGAVAIEEIRLLDGSENEIRIVPVDGFVTVEVTVNNTGTTTIDGPLILNLTIAADDGTYTKTATVNRPGPVSPGNTTVFSYSWAPTDRTLGEYKITARMTSPASAEGLVASFTVAETAVETGNIVDRTLSFYWVFGLFLFAIIVFFVVLAARRN
ncbi:MAG TPA: hypothetical protein VGB18_07080 [Candidatus Thermoplasmatota archaeon]